MRFYQLTPGEISTVNTLNSSRTNTILIVCDHGDGKIGVDADALESIEFDDYLTALGGTLASERIFTGEATLDGVVFS